MAESGGRTGALNAKGEYSVGLWQINLAADSGHPIRRSERPAHNARAAYDISLSGLTCGRGPPPTTEQGHRADYRTYLGKVENEIGVQATRAACTATAPTSGRRALDSSYDKIEHRPVADGGGGDGPGVDRDGGRRARWTATGTTTG